MRRSTLLVLVVLGAALAGFAFSSAAQQLREDDAPSEATAPASPQTVQLDWRETYGPKQIVFEVGRLQVLEEGWRASLALTNNTPVAYEIGDPRATLDRAFGLMLFATGDKDELDQRNRDGTLPAVRPAVSYKPSLPEILEPSTSWRGTISAPGALVAGSWVRVVFGTLFAIGVAPEGLDGRIVWMTDHAYRLRR